MHQRRTKIVCTIGPSSADMKMILAMLRAGMDVGRINFSHGDYEANGKLVKNIRGAAHALGKPVMIMQDLQGPRVRVSNVQKGGLELKEGETVIITTSSLKRKIGEQVKQKIFQVTYKGLGHDLSRGDIILIDDGLIKLKVLSIRQKKIKCRVLIGGLLTTGRGMNFPGVTLDLPAISKKDREDLEYGIKIGVDAVALSFVQRPHDIIFLRRLIKTYEDREAPRTKIIAKIEKKGALDYFKKILAEADGIMIARGDLGIEVGPTRIPLIQKEIITKCLEATKPVIVATQMLHSMQENPRPTRAEVSDVANAVIDHTDAVMLSQETATGKYPLESVKIMAEICEATESSHYDAMIYHNGLKKGASSVLAMSRTACILASDIRAKAILVTTRSGFSARAVVAHRPEMNAIVAVTNNLNVYRELSLSWGITPYLVCAFNDSQELVRQSLVLIKKDGLVKARDKVVVMTGFKERGNGWSSALRIVEI